MTRGDFSTSREAYVHPRITNNPELGDGEFSAVAELYVDGQLVERRSIQRHEQAYLTTLGDVPVGEAVFNIRPYYGRRVEVKIEASMRFNGGVWTGRSSQHDNPCLLISAIESQIRVSYPPFIVIGNCL